MTRQARAIPTKCRFCANTLTYIDFRDVNGNPHVWPYCEKCKRKQIRALTKDEKDLLRRAGLIVTPPEFSKAYSLYATAEEPFSENAEVAYVTPPKPQQASNGNNHAEIERLSQIVLTTSDTQEMAQAAMRIWQLREG